MDERPDSTDVIL